MESIYLYCEVIEIKRRPVIPCEYSGSIHVTCCDATRDLSNHNPAYSRNVREGPQLVS